METIGQITYLLMGTNRQFFTLLSHELAKFGVTIPQAFVIGEVQDGPKSIGEISKSLDLSYSTVSGIVDRLEKNKIIVRQRDEQDRRVVWVMLTKDFEELGETYPIFKKGYFEEYFSSCFQHLSGEELSTLLKSLQILADSLVQKQKSTENQERSEKT